MSCAVNGLSLIMYTCDCVSIHRRNNRCTLALRLISIPIPRRAWDVKTHRIRDCTVSWAYALAYMVSACVAYWL
ncbi:hypothetical protein GDO78_005586 [Eleutherodactylus coqui]|uniref:Uncharacterized protein n=1 Tax=Eleutherodactylus coqui TaxID=57060 RepID=A0A8J6KHZ7_ELECQ|nr:hypothetical protein GDO78_005586 [Eleutherodactylus coqui]